MYKILLPRFVLRLRNKENLDVDMDEKLLIETAMAVGFAHAAIMEVQDLVYIPEYRKYCEENICGNYKLMPTCPPNCGSSDDMYQHVLKYSKVLVLQTEMRLQKLDRQEYFATQREHNYLLDKLLEKLQLENCLVMSAGPWKKYSCMSAYCIDAAKMAESCNLTCWSNDGVVRYFSSILF